MKYILIILIFFLSGCSVQDWCAKHYPSNSTDSIWIDTVWCVDTVPIRLPTDTSGLQALIDCDSVGRLILRQTSLYKPGFSRPEIIIKDHVITALCVIDSMKVYKAVYSKIEKIRQVSKRVEKVETNILTWWQKTQIIAFWILFAIVCVVTGTWVLTKYSNIKILKIK